MPAVELWGARTRTGILTLLETSYFIGSDAEACGVTLDDATVSGIHAVLERVGTTWLIRDLGSRNGTWLNGERLESQRQLRNGDDVKLGRSRLVFRDDPSARRPITKGLAEPPPNLTPRERLVLLELCRPMLVHNMKQPAASVREIAGRMGTGRNAVQAHLTSLYDKFGIYEGLDGSRRVALAYEAIERGAVTRNDIRHDSPDGADRD